MTSSSLPLVFALPCNNRRPKRVATPASALQDGASRLVIGRPITQAENPREAVRLIIEEMEKVSK